jgi:hypothetical protein
MKVSGSAGTGRTCVRREVLHARERRDRPAAVFDKGEVS